MKYFSLLILVILTSCINRESPKLLEEEIEEQPSKPKVQHICSIDLSDKEGDFEFYRVWEFAGFQDIQTKQLDNLTCLARVADFALNGEDFDNIFKITLEFGDSVTLDYCQDLTLFQARTFSFLLTGCVEESIEGIKLHIDLENRQFFQGPASNTLPMIAFEEDFLKGLKETKVYEIENNKLYLYGTKGRHRMAFVALED